jgi:hypothetical protein
MVGAGAEAGAASKLLPGAEPKLHKNVPDPQLFLLGQLLYLLENFSITKVLVGKFLNSKNITFRICNSVPRYRW